MIRNPSMEMAVRKSRHFLFSWDFILPALILIAGTILFQQTDLDLRIQSAYYLGNGAWKLNNSALAMFIYHYGNISALLVSLTGLAVFILSYSKAKLLPYRKIGLYLVLAMIIGPGILVNSILKDNWGRPRPRDLINYNGDYSYEAPITIDPTSPGKSFPCGHATMGFFFYALAFVLRHRSRSSAAMILMLATVWGAVIGWVRIGMGGHFASDVLWAGMLVYLSSFLLYRVMGLHRHPYYDVSVNQPRKRLKLYQKVLLWSISLLIVCAVMLATPYSTKQIYHISRELDADKPHIIELSMQNANLEITPSEVPSISSSAASIFSYEAQGFGFPGSKLKTDSSLEGNRFTLNQRSKGFFTELSCNADLILSQSKLEHLSVSLDSGQVTLHIADSFADTVYVSETTEVYNSTPNVIVQKQAANSNTRLWFNTPVLKLITFP